MAVARVQSHMSQGTNAAPNNSFTSTSTAGNLLVYAIATGATVTMPSGWVLAAGPIGTTPAVSVYYYPNAPATTTVSATLSGSTRFATLVVEYSGFGAGTPNVLTATFGGVVGGTTFSVGPVAPASNAALVCAASVSASGSNLSAPSGGFSIVQQLSAGTSFELGWLEQLSAAGGSYTAGATVPTGLTVDAILVSLAVGSASGSLPLLLPTLSGAAGLQTLDGGLFT
jgi:hypothetical protein